MTSRILTSGVLTRRILLLFIAAILAACAQSPTEDEGETDEEIASNRARVHTELATAYYGAGQYEVALEEVRAALESDDDYVPAINQLGLIYLALGQIEDAQAQLERAIKLDPNDPSVNNNYGLLLCSLGDEAEAMRFFNMALNDPLYRTPEFAYVNAGLCVKNMGDYARAAQFLGRALALSPDQPQALYHMADLAFGRGDYGNARRYITRHLQVVIPGPDALWLAVRIENKLGNNVAVESYGAQLNRRFPDSAQTRAFNVGRYR
jgi:type IV pilus assembly protein PilF